MTAIKVKWTLDQYHRMVEAGVLDDERVELLRGLRNRVNVGEAEAIALAVEVEASRLLIDERLGRHTAKDFGRKTTGVLGILLLAKRQNLATAVKPIMDDLIGQANFRISRQLYADVLDEAGEQS